MKKVLLGLVATGVCLYAADFWVAKPAAEWSDKDVQKMLNNSPWARPFSVPLSGPTTQAGTAEGAGGGGRGGGGGGGRGGGPRGDEGGAGAGGGPPGGGFGGGEVALVARWQSAELMKQAFVRQRYGAKAETSDEAKQTLDRPETTYVLILTGNLRPFMRQNPEGIRKIITDSTVLSVKGKEPIKLLGVDVTPQQVIYQFSKDAPITLDDKEVDFTTKLADVVLKYKFKLKDMVVNGKLEL